MDVCLVLTHRCNLACTYCYAGEHHRGDMGERAMEGALDLLFEDAEVAQLSFFGGEPFVAFDAMKRAVESAQRRAASLGKKLFLQCTTNGTLLGAEQVAFVRETRMQVVVSIDGVAEAHDLGRPTAGGGSSFESALRGLRALLAAGVEPEVLMVVTPATAPFVFRSVQWLWELGVHTVRANLAVAEGWDAASRAELSAELVAVGRQLVWHRVHGRAVRFQPFETGARACGSTSRPPSQVVVGTTGHLYPCAPMVGEDRDGGPEARLRIGHVDDGARAIQARVVEDGAGCGEGRSCACAAYLETGNREAIGPNGRWFAILCREIGAATLAALDEAERTREAEPPEVPPPKRGRSFLRAGLILGGGGIALGGLAAYATLRVQGDIAPRPSAVAGDAELDVQDMGIRGEMRIDPPPAPTSAPSIAPDAPGPRHAHAGVMYIKPPAPAASVRPPKR